MIYGIDVSKYNIVRDWKAVKASGKSFVFIRLGWFNSDGSITPDGKFEEHYRNAISTGLDVGVYIYSYISDSRFAKVAARNTVEMLKGTTITYPVALDYEEYKIASSLSKEENTAICYEFLSEIQRLGYFAMMYTYTSFVQSFLNIDKLKGFAMWIADYREQTGTRCPYAGTWGIWQYKGDTGRCNGVAGACDLNISKYDYATTIKVKRLNGLKKSEPEKPKEILSPYKGRFKVTQEFKGKVHQGLDLVGIDSKSLYATVNGTVEIAGNNDPNGFGTYVRILASDGNRYYYGHMSSVAVRVCDKVKVGDYLGEEGSTGKSTGSHCHYEVRKTIAHDSFADINAISGIPNKLGVYEDKTEKRSPLKDAPIKSEVVIADGTWNIRSSPNTASKVVAVVKGGNRYKYSHTLNNWYYLTELKGWISGKGIK